MNWIKRFYELQYEMMGKPSDIAFQQDRIDVLEKHQMFAPKNILELGGGFGEFTKMAINKGYRVAMIELIASACAKAQVLFEPFPEHLEIICTDFYTINYKEIFDAVCYWDGFGIGDDEDQIRLLRLIHNALKKDGLLFVDVYNPLYWKQLNPLKMTLKNGEREYNFDDKENKMIDCWQSKETKHKECQYLKCYLPTDFELLIKGIGFKVLDIIPSGYVDYTQNTYHKTTDILKSMSYTFVLKKE